MFCMNKRLHENDRGRQNVERRVQTFNTSLNYPDEIFVEHASHSLYSVFFTFFFFNHCINASIYNIKYNVYIRISIHLCIVCYRYVNTYGGCQTIFSFFFNPIYESYIICSLFVFYNVNNNVSLSVLWMEEIEGIKKIIIEVKLTSTQKWLMLLSVFLFVFHCLFWFSVFLTTR